MLPITRRCSKEKSSRAFTLIEMLLVASLLSVTGLAVYHTIASGMRVWEYSRRYSAEEDVEIFFEKITADLQNSYSYSLIQFEGKSDQLFIPTIVRTPIDQNISPSGDIIEQMGGVEYFLQSGQKTIYRRQANYSQTLKKKFAEARPLAKPIESLIFKYFVIDDKKIKPKKKISSEIPVSVEVQVEFIEVGGNVRKLKRLINIPIGS
ncbi:MAG: prepilin-type N-terminal cleavage/methylation domain-containing protein [Candidatus Omnitrophica bacterium]|nr:prepilin-type N-terminal cleavage/methylation domain-containing protein [Candidatus Omnitrophota bacterium]